MQYGVQFPLSSGHESGRILRRQLRARGPSAHGLVPWGKPGSISAMGTGFRRCHNIFDANIGPPTLGNLLSVFEHQRSDPEETKLPLGARHHPR